MHLPVGAETGVKGGDDYIVHSFHVDSIVKPSNRSGASDSGIERLRIGEVLDNPRYTPDVVGVCYLNIGQFPGSEPGNSFLGNSRG